MAATTVQLSVLTFTAVFVLTLDFCPSFVSTVVATIVCVNIYSRVCLYFGFLSFFLIGGGGGLLPYVEDEHYANLLYNHHHLCAGGVGVWYGGGG